MPFGKWKDFDSCVSNFVGQGKDEESAKKICGDLQARLGKESFSWTGDIQSGDKHNLIRGKAVHPVKTFHPEEWLGVRVYLEEELQKAAHTLAGQPLCLDHLQPLNGKVLAAQYEDGAVEYVAELNDEQVLNWVKDGTVKHCSVEYDWESLVKVNGVAPHNIAFSGLALLKDFLPGDPQSSVEVWEALLKRLKEAKEKKLSEQDDKDRQAQKARAEKYGISPKEGGNLTKPKEYENIPDDEFADPVNYRYPVDKDHVDAALKYFNVPDNRSAGGYSHEEQVKMMTKIITAALGNGIEVSWQPEDPVYKGLPEELKKKLAGYETITKLEGQVAALTIEKKTLEAKIGSLEQEKTELTKRLGEAVIEPGKQQEDLKTSVLKALKEAVYERVPQRWGYGPYEQNRKIKALIKKLGG